MKKKISNIRFKYNLFKLKRLYNTLIKKRTKYKKIVSDKNKFFDTFVKDEEDKFLNASLLHTFDKDIQKNFLKILKLKNEIEKILNKINIVNVDFISTLYDKNLSEADLRFIKSLLFLVKISK